MECEASLSNVTENNGQAMDCPSTPTIVSSDSNTGDPMLIIPNVSPEKKHQISELSLANDQEISGIAPENEPPLKSRDCTPVHHGVGAGDTSVTDDEIEVICRYSSPKIDIIHAEQAPGTEGDCLSLQKCQGSEGNSAEIGKMPVLQNQQKHEESIGQEQHIVCNPAMYPHLFYTSMMMPRQESQDSIDVGRQTHISDMNGQFLPIDYGQSSTFPHNQYLSVQYNMPLSGMSPPVCYGDSRSYIQPPAPGQKTETVQGEGQPNMYGLLHVPQQHSNGTSEDSVSHETEAEQHKSPPPHPAFDQPLPFCHQIDDYQGNMYPRFSEEPFTSQPEMQTFVYPSIYVSNSGLITVMLKHDVSVEMTVDRTIRVVSHNQKMAVATNSRGTASIMHHPCAKAYQEHTTTDLHVNNVNAKMTTNYILFGSDSNCYKFDFKNIEVASPRFTNLANDKTVELLFASEAFGSNLVAQCLHIAGIAEYENLPKGGLIIRINGAKITQNGRGEVSVVTGPKFLKVSPGMGTMRINTHFAEIVVDKDGILNVRRGNHEVNSSNGSLVLSNGKIEAGFDRDGKLKAWSLPRRTPLEITRDHRKPRPGNPRRKATALGGQY
ncbi:hypothetical protein LOTGIDRAFT_236970 [Lottia gigantea]|uniref:Uncharacterized protein n=1 Tax=Lottia gigantea TaxID=225164 RepID=V3ZNN9_LOTGI|nr:hypothetical protein LOTGIDRAFT_236970 [Lottia gigantea]ESO82476.1 hypothetical protein LOTGIDRAFT_236970 [Lottia gigantea]